MFNEKKIIGHGNKSFSFKCQDYVVNQASCSSHPHNIYFQILAENGIFNFILVSSLFLIILSLFFKSFTSKYIKKNLR